MDIIVLTVKFFVSKRNFYLIMNLAIEYLSDIDVLNTINMTQIR